ncbi:MAG: FAD-dependent oxidoreductase [Thermoanaerobaculia bacterium]
MSRVTIVGGGVSGLVTAYYLAREGVSVTLLEKQERLGGLVDTLRTPYGPVEAAASGIRSSARFEEICRELDVPLVTTMKESRKRYLYRGAPRQWPLGPAESLGFAGKITAHYLTRTHLPRPGESVNVWGERVLGRAPTHYILGAALQGIYAGDPAELSASMIMGKMRQKPAKGEKKGLVAPPVGLIEFIEALTARLKEFGVEIRTGVSAEPSLDGEGAVVISTSAKDAATLLRERAPGAAEAIGSIEMLPLLRVTAFYPESENTVKGFGILFPREEGVRALGVLFNTNIFPNRGEGHSESWIYGGAQDRGVVDLDDDAILEMMNRDRETLYRRRVEPIACYPQRWPLGLPHYDLHLEELRRKGFELPSGIFLAGNYLRGIGLPLLLEQSYDTAGRVRAWLAR